MGAEAVSGQHSGRVIAVMGPTAAGKTDLAIALAERLGCTLISVDSAMVYRQMDIGTAKPDAETLQRAPHQLIDIRDPADSYSSASFCQDARAEIESALAAGSTPLLVGGTMLYFRSLLQGLARLPKADAAIRQQLTLEAAEHGWQSLHERLQQVDPEAAQRIHSNDAQRLQRALEVYELTGKPISQLWKEQQSSPLPYRVERLIVAPAERATLHQRIATRFHAMVSQGLIEEVEQLYRRDDLNADLPSMRSVGYRQVWGYLAGDYGREEMVERGIAATRQLAKRQYTWLRGEDEGVPWIDSEVDNILDKGLKIIERHA